MFVLESYASAVIFCVITMFCWGSWANTQKLASKDWRFELYYWDYAIGVLLLSLVFALTLGSSGAIEGRQFYADIAQAEWPNIYNALIGGVLFNAANILLVAAIALAGMSVAFPVGIGLALVIGVVVNYLADPLGNPLLLFGGVALVAIAIVLTAAAYKRLNCESSVSTKGLVLSLVAGVLMGFFYRFVANSMSTDFVNPEEGKLTPYTAVVFFAVGLFLSCFIFNTLFMKKPVAGEPVSYLDYLKGSFKMHCIGVLGGIIWGTGMSLNILASGQAGFAISYGLGQGATMIAAFWGVFIWKEFQNAPAGTNKLISLMFVCFILGLASIVVARLN